MSTVGSASQIGHGIQHPTSGIVVDERLSLDGDRLHVSFRTAEPFLTAALQSLATGFSRRLPALSASYDYSCQFNLNELPEGDDFTISLRAANGAEYRWGRLTALRQQELAPSITKRSKGTQREAIAQTSFRRDGLDLHAWVYVDLVDLTVGLRVSATNDNEQFLARAGKERTVSVSDPVRFSVVSAVYNVEKYIDDYFRSILEQSLDFRSHIELIVVDDGSTDGSAKKIKRWQRKYPGNIRYFHKPNGGPASARNVGLDHASHAWVTFIDPDDLVERDYFAEVAWAIDRHGSSVAMVSCNTIFYYERSATKVDKHPLRFRFAAGERAVAADDLGRFVQLSAPSAFFLRDLIVENQLRFDERIRPNFEDAHFAGRYLLRAGARPVVFLPQARYIYRRRADDSSLLQTGERHPGLYSDQVRYGYIGLLRDAANLRGNPPRQVQLTVLYSLCWHFQRIVDHPESVSFLSNDQKREFLDLLLETFSHIDAAVIMDYDVYGLPFAHRVGILNLFKGTAPPVQRVEVTKYDGPRAMVKVLSWSRQREPTASFSLDAAEIEPTFQKSRRVDFAGTEFYWEHIAWVPMSEVQTLAVTFAGSEAEIHARGSNIGRRVTTSQVRLALTGHAPAEVFLPAHVRDLRRAARRPKEMSEFKDAWLFMDRDAAADDSAERLYRYVRRQAPHINSFFILNRGSPDWGRLTADGFRLLGFNEPEHALGLLNATYLISSQADHYVLEYLGSTFADMLKYRFVFLQHGVIKDDISSWLNQLPVDCLITSTQAEFDSIVADGSPYKLTEKEVVLTGLPRHDSLLDGPTTDSRTIVIMPTWRAHLTGAAEGAGNARSPVEAFYHSEFALRWKALLHSPRLRSIAEGAGCRLVFIPHPNIEQYLDFFRLPSWAEVRRFGGGAPIENTFRNLTLFVTDFSSKAFDVAYLEKPVVYYQFDRGEFFGGGHTSRPGYFDYVRDGFGPVCHDESDLLDSIAALLPAGGRADQMYRERAARTFSFRDGKCCERVFQAILGLDLPLRQQPHVVGAPPRLQSAG